MNFTLDDLQALDRAHCRALFMRICGSPAWAAAMTRQRPYCCVDGLLTVAVDTWRRLPNHDKRDAIMHHPRIGATKIDTKEYDETERKFIAQEASHKGKKPMPPAIRRQFEKLNDEYYNKFGYVYVVSAFGKSDEEMLSLLKRRLLGSDHDREFQNSSDEEEQVLVRRLGELFKQVATINSAPSHGAVKSHTPLVPAAHSSGSCWNATRALRSRL
jgi:OHCU decarboxylase